MVVCMVTSWFSDLEIYCEIIFLVLLFQLINSNAILVLVILQIHNKHLLHSITNRLVKVACENADNRDYIEESVANLRHDREFGKECPVCGKEYAKGKQKCKESTCNNAVLCLRKHLADDNP